MRTYIIENSGPSLHGDTLKDGQHGEADVIKADDAPLGSLPVQLALGYVGRTRKPAGRRTVFNRRHRARCELLLPCQIPLSFTHSTGKQRSRYYQDINTGHVITDNVPPVKLSTYGPRSFAVAGPTIWNNLPEYLRDPELSIDNFWRQLKTFPFAQ